MLSLSVLGMEVEKEDLGAGGGQGHEDVGAVSRIVRDQEPGRQGRIIR